MTEVLGESLQAGRAAASRYAWADAYRLLKEADAGGEALSGGDFELLGHSALWVGRLPESIEAYERAYARYLEEGNNRKAASAALFLASEYRNKLQQAVSMGWHQRARRLLEEEPDSVERGFLELQMSQFASGRGDIDEALGHIRRALEIAKRVGDRDLAAQATLREGIALVKMGEVDAGLALIDEVSASA